MVEQERRSLTKTRHLGVRAQSREMVRHCMKMEIADTGACPAPPHLLEVPPETARSFFTPSSQATPPQPSPTRLESISSRRLTPPARHPISGQVRPRRHHRTRTATLRSCSSNLRVGLRPRLTIAGLRTGLALTCWS